MTLGLHSSRIRERRRRRWLIVKWFLALVLIAAAGAYAYETGSDLARRDEERLREQASELSRAVESLRAENADLRAAVEAAKLREDHWRERYERDVVTGRVKDLLELVREKLAAGVDPGRLAFVIGAARNESECDEKPVTKRFIVQNPLYDGANDSVTFAEGAITVTAEGEAAASPDGDPQAWFDPGQPVTLRFTVIGGASHVVTGILPLHKSVVVKDTEHRFSVVAGERGFVNVTGDTCRYP